MTAEEGQPLRGNADSETRQQALFRKQAMLVNLISNAFYDVTRYPGHVVWITETKADRRVFLEQMIDQRERTNLSWILRCILGLLMVSAIPLVTIMVKKPYQCRFEHLQRLDLPGMLNATEEVLAGLEECDVYSDDRWGSREGILPLALVPLLVGPCWYFGLTVTMWVSLLCTRRIYNTYVRVVLSAFSVLKGKVEPVLFNGLKKPISHSLSSITDVAHRIWYFPYLLLLMFLTIIVLFIWMAMTYGEYSWGVLLSVFVYQTYFPAMAWIYGTDHSLMTILMSELRRKELQESDVVELGSYSNNLYMKLTNSRDNSLMPQTDVWSRLFNNTGPTFALNRCEISYLVRYFEANQKGLDWRKEKHVAWPIWWHDDLCLTGNGKIRDIYVEDLNILLSVDAGSAYSSSGYTFLGDPSHDDAETEKFLDKIFDRISKLYAERDKFVEASAA